MSCVREMWWLMMSSCARSNCCWCCSSTDWVDSVDWVDGAVGMDTVALVSTCVVVSIVSFGFESVAFSDFRSFKPCKESIFYFSINGFSALWMPFWLLTWIWLRRYIIRHHQCRQNSKSNRGYYDADDDNEYEFPYVWLPNPVWNTNR